MDDSLEILLKKRLRRISEYLESLESFLLSKERGRNLVDRSGSELVEEHDRLSKQQVALVEALRRAGYSLDKENFEVMELAKKLLALDPDELVQVHRSLLRVVKDDKSVATEG